MGVIRRLSLATQLVAVQLILIAAVLLAVSAVSVEQTRATFERVEGRRVLALAESLAANPTVRLKPVEQAGSPLPATVASLQSTTGVDLAAVADLEGVIVVSTDPRLDRHDPALAAGAGRSTASMVGDGEHPRLRSPGGRCADPVQS